MSSHGLSFVPTCREKGLCCFFLFTKGHQFYWVSLTTSFHPNCLPKGLSLNTVTLGIRASTYEFGENTIQFITHTQPYRIKINKTYMIQIAQSLICLYYYFPPDLVNIYFKWYIYFNKKFILLL